MRSVGGDDEGAWSGRRGPTGIFFVKLLSLIVSRYKGVAISKK